MTDKIYRSKINRLIRELRVYTSLPLKDNYNVYFRSQNPDTRIGNLGDWAVNLLSGTIFLRIETTWKPIEGLVTDKSHYREIYTTSANRPDTPKNDRNPGWSAVKFEKTDYHFTSLWSSKALYIGDVRVGIWSVPSLVIKGSKTNQVEPLRFTTVFIYNSSEKKPLLKRRVNDPTADTGWTRGRSSFKSKSTPVWMSRAQLDQHGKLHGYWSVPIQVSGEQGKPGEDGSGLEAHFDGDNLVITSTKPGVGPISKHVKGDPGKKVLLEYDTTNNLFVQRYEGEPTSTPVATRDTILGAEITALPGRVSSAETALGEKLNITDIADWAKEPSKPGYTPSEIGAKPNTWFPSWNEVAAKPDVIIEGDSRLTDSRPASDVPAWAKQSTKPSYSPNEIGAHPNTWKPAWNDVQSKPSVIIEGDARLTNSRPASDVPAWAKAATKPAYSAAEVGARPSNWNPDYANILGTKPPADANRFVANDAVNAIKLDADWKATEWNAAKAEIDASKTIWDTVVNKADVSELQSLQASLPTNHNHSAAHIVSGELAVSRGGTGAGTAEGARINLGLTGNNNATHYHDNRYVKLAGDTMTDTLIIQAQGDGKSVLKFNTERAWEFRQMGNGAGAELSLVDLNGSKWFNICDINGGKIFRVFGSTTAPRVVVNGNLGIGTTVPSEKLDVAGSARITDALILDDLRSSTIDKPIIISDAGNDLRGHLQFGKSTTNVWKWGRFNSAIYSEVRYNDATVMRWRSNGSFSTGNNTPPSTDNSASIAGVVYISSPGSSGLPALCVGATNTGIFSGSTNRIDVTVLGSRRSSQIGSDFHAKGDIVAYSSQV